MKSTAFFSNSEFADCADDPAESDPGPGVEDWQRESESFGRGCVQTYGCERERLQDVVVDAVRRRQSESSQRSGGEDVILDSSRFHNVNDCFSERSTKEEVREKRQQTVRFVHTECFAPSSEFLITIN